MFKWSFVLFAIVGLFTQVSATNSKQDLVVDAKQQCYLTFSSDSDSVFIHRNQATTLTPKDSTHKPSHENIKLVAAVLAFPFPFGMIGLHRIYLGTNPWVPFVYLVTLGGCFGVLPFIDFVVILMQDEETLEQYRNNGKIFMWVN
jgi:TM2 domain-containing membrane protein YozV